MSPRIPKKGYIGYFKLRGISIYIHWSFPVGGLFLAKFLGDFTWYSIVCLVLAYTTLIIIHELGHAFAAKLYSCEVKVVLVTWAGGWCIVDEPQSYVSSLIFYAGGIIAQLFLLLATTSFITIFGSPTASVMNYFILVFTVVNAVLIIVNLIPARGSDGEKIWALIKNRN